MSIKLYLKNHKEKIYHASYLLFFNLVIISILFFLLNWINIINIDLILSPDWLFAIAVFSLVVSLIYKYKLNLIENKKNQFIEKVFQVSPYFFLPILIILIINPFFKLDFISIRIFNLTILGVGFGFLTFYKNRDKVEAELENENVQEEKAEIKRVNEFEHEFPKINNIPVLRSIVKWMYKEGWWYSIGLLIFLVITSFLLFYHLGSYDFKEDEFLAVDSATSFLNTGTFYKWDWISNQSGLFTDCIEMDSNCDYTRAWPHTILLVLSYAIFGINEWSSRLVSAIFGIIFIFFSYFFFKFFTESKKTALLVIFMLSFYSFYIELFRYTRMYALLVPIFLLLCLLIFLALTKKNEIKKINKYSDYINYKFIYFIWAGILIILAYLLHINSLVILPVSSLFVLYLSIKEREKRYMFLAGFIILLALFIGYLLVYTNVLSNISLFLCFFGRNNKIYLNYLISYPLGVSASIVLASFLFMFVIFNKNNNLKNKLIFLLILTLFALGFFVYIADRYPSFLYISHITPISVGIIFFSFTLLTKIYNKKALNYLLMILIIIIVLFSFYGSFDRIYNNDTSYGKFKIAYQTIEDNYKDGEVIFGQYLRNYYLQNLPNDVIVVNMLNNELYTYQQFSQDIKKYDFGWVTWETRKGYHLQNNIKDFISKNFQKIHGPGIDNTNVEVYYFDKNMKRP